jgi:hypothetical protein
MGQMTVCVGDVGFGMAEAARRRSFVEAMLSLLDQWSEQTPDQRLASVQVALQAVKPPSMPSLTVNPTDLEPRLYGQLEFTSWQINVNQALLNGEMTDSRMAELSNTLYHEARHGEQWYNAAQSQAASGAGSEAIASRMHLPRNVASAAVGDPAPRGTPSGEMGAAVHTSVYGSRATQRNETLNNMDADGNYEKYRALPEEQDAWTQGDAVESEYHSQIDTSP